MNLERFTVTPQGELPLTVFDDHLLSKNAWGFALGISEKTLQRWEREIVDKSELKNVYHWHHKKINGVIRPNPLDGYRRFVMTVIYQLKVGNYDANRRTNPMVREWVNTHKVEIGRTNFYKWRQRHGI